MEIQINKYIYLKNTLFSHATLTWTCSQKDDDMHNWQSIYRLQWVWTRLQIKKGAVVFVDASVTVQSASRLRPELLPPFPKEVVCCYWQTERGFYQSACDNIPATESMCVCSLDGQALVKHHFQQQILALCFAGLLLQRSTQDGLITLFNVWCGIWVMEQIYN